MVPHNVLAKTRLSNHSKVSSGVMPKPNAGVTPNVPNDHTTILYLSLEVSYGSPAFRACKALNDKPARWFPLDQLLC
jgi:hypothetical protein